jgi:hypothetical protein
MNQYKGFSWWSRKLSALFVPAICVGIAVLATAPEAFAQPTFGKLNPETVANQQLQLQGDFSEARNGQNNDLLEVWRGGNNNRVWMSLNNGPAFTIGATQTFVDPTVVPYGPESFLVMHVGTDNGIYYTVVNTNNTRGTTWFRIPNQTTTMPVSAVQVSPRGFQVNLVYRGTGNLPSGDPDRRVWATEFVGDANVLGFWTNPVNIGGGTALDAPAITLNPLTNRFFVAVRGTNGHLWLINAPVGGAWGTWLDQGVTTTNRPSIAAAGNGRMVANIVEGGLGRFATYDAFGNRLTEWAADSVSPDSNAIYLAVAFNAIFALYNLNGLGWWRQVNFK